MDDSNFEISCKTLNSLYLINKKGVYHMRSNTFMPLFCILFFLSSANLFGQEAEFISSSRSLNAEPYSESYLGYTFQHFDNAGDLNGDGILDFTNKFTYPDFSTSELEDYVEQRFYYYGSDLMSIDPDAKFDEVGQLAFMPVGDLNGDSYGDYYLNDGTLNFDLSGGQRAEIISTPIVTSLNINKGSYETGRDLNNDGYEDLLLFHESLGYNRQLEFEIIYGAGNIDSVTATVYTVDVTVNDSDRLYTSASFTSKDLDEDCISEILVYGYSDNSFTETEGDFLILKKNQLSEYDVVFRYNLFGEIHSDAEQIYLGEFSDGGLPEVFFQSDDGYPTILELDYVSGEFIVNGETEIEEYQYATLYPIGDFDGNGIEDFYTYGLNYDESLVLFGKDTAIGEFVLAEIILEDGVFTNGQPPLVTDFDVDGKDDFILGFNEINKAVNIDQEDLISTGFFIFKGNEERNFDEFQMVKQESPAIDTPLYTFNAGDFNNDDIADYGIVYKTSVQAQEKSRVELYFGTAQKADMETPGIIFQHEEGLSPSFPATGDFNGDGISDLAINYEDSSSGIYIYFGGSQADQNPDYQITVRDLNPNNNSFFQAFIVVENIGDINGDGVDDLFFSSRYISPVFTKGFILFGGDNISVTPDLELSFKAINATALGDIDADGKDEILVFNNQSTGYIYQSFDEDGGEQFNSEPKYVLSLPSIPGSTINQFGVSTEAGDFDGDGVLDLAVKSAIHVDGSRIGYTGFLYEGAPAIYVYYGGENFDEEYDQSFKIPLEFIRRFDLEDDQTTSFSFNEFGELTLVPDINNDGTDELLFATDQGASLLTNALLFMGNEERSDFGNNIGYVFEAMNTNLGLGSLNNDLESFTSHSAVGDFNADGEIDILMPQGEDWNLKVDPVLLYSFGNIPVSIDEQSQIPNHYLLLQNYPNPFNPKTKISYKLPKGGAVKLEVFDISGKLIATIVNERQEAGSYNQNFDASSLASGVYFYRLETASYTQTRKMLLIK